MAAEGPLTHLYDHVLPESNNRVWTHKIIEEMNTLRQKLNLLNERTALDDKLGDFGHGTKYTSPDVLGNHHEREVPEKPKDGQFLDLIIEPYWDIAKGLSACATDSSAAQPLYSIVTRPTTRHQKFGLCHGNNTNTATPYELWKDRWLHPAPPHGATDWKCWRKTTTLEPTTHEYILESVNMTALNAAEREEEERCFRQWWQTRESLKTAVVKHGHALMNVDKILCFGLGSLDCRRPKTFVQHLAAVTIRDALLSFLGNRNIDRTIPIFAQDPAYCENCRDTLSTLLPDFHPITDFDGFKKVDKHSLVITVAPSAPVCQIISDLTLDDGGPAAIVCDLFGDDYLAQERDPDGDYTCDEPTKNIVEYKSRCEKHSIGDIEMVLKMDYETFLREYLLPADLGNEWKAIGKDVYTGENIMLKESKWYAKCNLRFGIKVKDARYKPNVVFYYYFYCICSSPDYY